MTTRSKKKSPETAEKATMPIKRVENSWILLAKDSLLENDSFSIVTIPHPAHRRPAKYCLDEAHNKIYEVVTFSEPHRSWFIGETVKSDGSLLMLSPVNPLFIVLPRLKELCSTRAMPLEDILSEKGYDKIVNFINSMDKIADLKGPVDLKAYKYNEEKTSTWLTRRVLILAKVLREKNIHVTSGATSATFVASNICNESVDEEFYLKYAFGMISEYLEDSFIDMLEKKFNFKPDLIESLGKKRKSEAGENNDTNKKIKCESSDYDTKENGFSNSNNNVSEVKKQKSLTAKEKARQKAASGTKTISSFFSKK